MQGGKESPGTVGRFVVLTGKREGWEVFRGPLQSLLLLI